MTGYGASASSTSALEINVSLRSVNGRYLEQRFHIPREYIPFENEIKKKVSAKLKRGTVDIYIHRKATSGAAKVSVDTSAATQWVKAYKELSKHLKVKTEIDLQTVASQPGVLQLSDRSEVGAAEKKLLFAAVDKAIANCDKARGDEGKTLVVEIKKYLKGLSQILRKVDTLKKQANALLKERFHKRLEKLGVGEEVDAQRFSQEVVFQIDKADITEEIIRFKSHIDNYQKLITAKDSQGKKLDFYCQELLREVNTMGSKAQMSELTDLVVEAKALIEKLREQVQNLE